jgi:hypothetical protein
MIKLYLTKVLCYKSFEKSKPCKCNISTIPVEAIESDNGITIYKSQISPETIEIPSKKYFYRKTNYLHQIVIYFCLFESEDLNTANKESISMIKSHFATHHLFVNSLYKKFTDILTNHL